MDRRFGIHRVATRLTRRTRHPFPLFDQRVSTGGQSAIRPVPRQQGFTGRLSALPPFVGKWSRGAFPLGPDHLESVTFHTTTDKHVVDLWEEALLRPGGFFASRHSSGE